MPSARRGRAFRVQSQSYAMPAPSGGHATPSQAARRGTRPIRQPRMDVTPPHPVVYAVVIAIVLGLCVWALWRSSGQWTTIVMAACNVLSAVPVFLLGCMRAAGASPISQLNGANRDWWHLWSSVWPLLLLGMLIVMGAMLAVWIGIIMLSVRRDLRGQLYMHLSVAATSSINTGAAFLLTGLNFPDA